MTWRERGAAWREGETRLTNATLVTLGLLLVVLAHQFSVELGHFVIGFDKVSLLSVVVYVAAVIVVRTQPVNRTTLRLVIGLAVPMYACTYLASPDRMSSDIYRYVWDGIVQHAHVNPYRYVPGNAALSYLREPNQDVYDGINRRDYAPTIYPPAAQVFYWLATYFAPTVEAMKLFMLAWIALTAWALAKVLQLLGRPASEILTLLWCPLVVWEIGNAGHVDAIVCGLVACAVLFRLRRAPVLCGVFLGLAVMTKFYPLLLFPALWQRRDWKMPAVVAAICAGGYALYSSVGMKVFGFLSGYQKEEGIDSGSRFFVLDFAHRFRAMAFVQKNLFLAFCAVVLGGLVLWCWRHATTERAWRMGEVPAVVRGSAMLAFALMLLFSPHYAWYNVWLVPFLVLWPNLPMFVYVLGFFYGYTTALAAPGPTMFLLNERLYGAVLVAFALAALHRRWPVWPRVVSALRDVRGEGAVELIP